MHTGQLIILGKWQYRTHAFFEAPLLAKGEDGGVAGHGTGSMANLGAGERLSRLQRARLRRLVVGRQCAELLKIDGVENFVRVILFVRSLDDLGSGLAHLQRAESARLLAGLLRQ